MKSAQALIAACATVFGGSQVTFGQGVVVFNNRITPIVDARVTFLDGAGVGAGFTAQLYGGPAGSSIEQLTPLFPVTTFRTVPAAALGYIFPKDVRVPDIPPHDEATVVMRVFNSSTWENSSCRGESNPITVILSNGIDDPFGLLLGLQPFSVNCVPEPGTLTLLGLAAGGSCLIRWMNPKANALRV